MASLASDHGRLLTEQDVAQGEEAKRAWLAEQVAQGKTVCATIGDAQSRSLGLELEEGFNPSAPFVATASAALVVAQALKSLLYPDTEFVQRFQIESLFVGPEASHGVLTIATPTCECVAHRTIIEQLAAARRVRRPSSMATLCG